MIGPAARSLFPFSLAVAAAILLKGYEEVGDGFSAGAVAALGAVLQFVGRDHGQAARVAGARLAWPLVSGGLVLALVVVLAPVFGGVAPVTHLPPPSGHLVHLGALGLHTPLVFDLGIALLVYGALVVAFDRLVPAFPDDDPRDRGRA